jgi:LacI family transcriptional regulator
VVTLATDLPFSRRVAYVGVDNRAAGATAAYLVTRWSGRDPGGVLVTLSSTSFRGEEEREIGFRATLRELAPQRPVVEVTDTDGLDGSMLQAVGQALAAEPSLDAVYSIGGGNTATLAAFRAAGRTPSVFVAHDLDGDNRALLRTRQVSAVLHHDLRADLRRACRLILQARGALPGVPLSVPSQINVVTPYNEPGALVLPGSE